MALKRGIEKHYLYMQEKMLTFCHTNDYKITNERAKYVLAYCFKIPLWLQPIVLNNMVDMNLLQRIDKFELKINKRKL